MKKSMLLALALCTLLCGCRKPPENDQKEVIVTPTPVIDRTRNISGGITDNGQSFSYKYDMDFDGEKEEISMTVAPGAHLGEAVLSLSVGEYQKQFDMMEGYICDVYACDIDTQDGVFDIAFITTEASDDPRIRIIKYGPELLPYQFKLNDDGGIYDELWIGYAVSHHFTTNFNDTITIEEQTSSRGMWSVFKTYKRNKTGVFEEIVPEFYDILTDFIERQLSYDTEMDDEERTMWETGFIKAYTDYNYNGVSISEGDYIRPLYDDGNNKIIAEREDGEKIILDLETDLSNFNSRFFFLAG